MKPVWTDGDPATDPPDYITLRGKSVPTPEKLQDDLLKKRWKEFRRKVSDEQAEEGVDGDSEEETGHKAGGRPTWPRWSYYSRDGRLRRPTGLLRIAVKNGAAFYEVGAFLLKEAYANNTRLWRKVKDESFTSFDEQWKVDHGQLLFHFDGVSLMIFYLFEHF